MNLTLEARLDRPAWAALTTLQQDLGVGNDVVRRYLPAVSPFAGLSSEGPDAWQALGELVRSHEPAIVQSLRPAVEVATLRATPLGVVHQMVAARSPAPRDVDASAVRLGAADADEVQALVQRTRPGPFAARTMEMGEFIGIRQQGRLVAMAGERMRMEGGVEISAVCVDDAWRGRGIAGRLVNAMCERIEARRALAFLHVLSDNRSAIGLYERACAVRSSSPGLKPRPEK